MAKKKFLKENNEQVWPITRIDCVYTMDGQATINSIIDEIEDSLEDKQDKLTYKDNVLVYKRFNEGNAENAFEMGTNKMLIIESLNLEEGKKYSVNTLADKIIPMSLDSPVENISADVISFELKATAVKMEDLGDMLGFAPIGFTITFSTEYRDYEITVFDKLKADSVEDEPYYSEEHAVVLLSTNLHYVEIGVEKNIESEVTDEFLETYKFVTQVEKDNWNNKIENSDLEEIYSSLEDISAKANEKLLYSEHFNTIEIDSMTNSTFEYRGFLAYKNIDGLLGMEVDTYYDLELTFNDGSVVRYSKLLSDHTKNIRHDDGNIIINVSDNTKVYNNGNVSPFAGTNTHSVYGYNITNLKQVKIYKSSEVTDEFLETHRFVTEEEKVNWNNKQDKEDANLSTENKTIVGAINEVKTNKADKSELFSGSYNDLTNKPEIPSIEGLATEEYVNNALSNQNHTTLWDIEGLYFASDETDAAAIEVTRDGENTYMDFYLDDDTDDMWRWRSGVFVNGEPPVIETFDVMTLRAINESESELDVTGNVKSLGLIGISGEEWENASRTIDQACKFEFSSHINKNAAGLFPTENNSNSIISFNRYDGEYSSQLGFNSNGQMYYRHTNGEAITEQTEWQKIYTDRNKPTPEDIGAASEEFVNNMLSGLRLIQMTQSEYDALEVKDSNTLYIIVN